MKAAHFFRTIGLARRNFWANKRRNFFSIITVILGSLAIGAVFTVNANVNSHIEQLIARSGGPNLFIQLRGHRQNFDSSDFQELSSLTSARYAVVESMTSVNALYEGKSQKLTAHMTGANYRLARPVQMISGQFLSTWDEQWASNNVVLSTEAVTLLGLTTESAVGLRLTLHLDKISVAVIVVGVAKPLFDANDRGNVWLPRRLFQALSQDPSLSSVILGSSSYLLLEEFQKQVENLLGPKYKQGFEVYNPRRSFEGIRREYETFIMAGAIVGVLALIAGAVGVMNLMLVGIQLRIREIGLYRALGFPTNIVLLAFLTESLLILSSGGLLGAIAGSALGIGVAAQIVTSPPFFSVEAFGLALASSFSIGFAFAYIPARSAAQMDTVEALRG